MKVSAKGFIVLSYLLVIATTLGLDGYRRELKQREFDKDYYRIDIGKQQPEEVVLEPGEFTPGKSHYRVVLVMCPTDDIQKILKAVFRVERGSYNVVYDEMQMCFKPAPDPRMEK